VHSFLSLNTAHIANAKYVMFGFRSFFP